MSEPERVDVLVLGSGEAGKFLAWHMASTGQRTAVVERKLIGGSCPNTNCLPSKNEIWSAKVADLVRHADRFGTVAPAVAVDMAKVLAHKREMIDGLIAMHLERYRASGAELIMGTGRFVAPKTIAVSLNDGGSRVLTGDKVVINVGTRATIPDIAGLHAAARSKAAIYWPRSAAPRTPPGSASTWPESGSTNAAMSRSTIGWRRAPPMSGPSASALAARSSPMSRSTISASSGTIWPAAIAVPAVGSCRIACSPTPRLVASA